MITRDFLPVGQGAFYHEKFSINSDYINIIYDCGSATNIDIIKKQITDNFSKDEVIHAVFISHLDEDHINGLPFLLQHCTVKNIFFPLVSKIDSIYLQISQYIEHSGNIPLITSLLNNFREAVREMSGDKGINTNFYYIGNRDEINEEDLQILNSGTDVSNIIFGNHYPFRDWVLIPFNFRHDERLKQLKISLNDCLGRDMSNKDLKEVWENGGEAEREKIKNCYRAVKGSFNTNSMTLYSGMKKNVLTQSFPCDFYSNYMCSLKYKSSGAMYLGDYDLSGKYKWEEF